MAQDIITVTPSRGPGGQIKWKLCHGTKCGGPGANPASAYPVIEIPADNSEHVVVITINDPQHTGVVFASNATNPTAPASALAVVPGQGHHPTSGINSDNQFKDITLASPTTLVFTDKNDNPNEMWLSYGLNFVNAQGQAVTSIDPDWKNGGGGGGSPAAGSALTTAILIIGLATLAAVLYVAVRQSNILQLLRK